MNIPKNGTENEGEQNLANAKSIVKKNKTFEEKYNIAKKELLEFKLKNMPSAKKLYSFFKKKIKKIILDKINDLTIDKKFALYLFLKSSPELVCIKNLWKEKYENNINRFFIKNSINQDDFIKILIDLGLLYKKEANNSDEDYHYPEYFDELKEIILDYLGKCGYCGAKMSPRAKHCPKCGDPSKKDKILRL